MSEVDFRIVYEGGEADQHVMDMRMLALSMLGAERIISDGLIILVHRRLPKRGERAPVIAKAREPGQGSVALLTLFNAIFGALPLGLPLAKELVSHFLEEWWKAVIARFSGKPDVVEAAIKAMVDMNQAHLDSRDASDARRHEETMALIGILRRGIEGQQRPVEQFSIPVGPSVASATVYPDFTRAVPLNIPDAEAIRDSGKLDWGPLEQITLKTDGFRFHTSGLSVENPERDGFLMARVRDPRFSEPENPYTEAAQRMAQIVVVGRRGYKASSLTGIEIVDFVRDLPA